VADEGQERHLPATAKRRREFRERGETPRSRELAGVAVLLAGILTMAAYGPVAGDRLAGLLRTTLRGLSRPEPLALLSTGLGLGGVLLALPFGFMMVAAVAAHLVQGELSFSPRALEPRWDRIDPFARLQQLLLSRRTLVELVKSVAKVTLVGVLCAWFVAGELPGLQALSRVRPAAVLAHLGRLAVRLATVGATGLTLLALADALYSRWDLERRMRMTPKEMKDDLKEQEGDPLLRSRRRQRHRELSLNRLLSEVPRADVVVANPTHVAVALRYDAERWPAPRVTAKGADALALRIRTIARQHGVPVVENRPLARELFRLVKVGHTINEKMFRAVAEIYAFLHRLRGGGA